MHYKHHSHLSAPSSTPGRMRVASEAFQEGAAMWRRDAEPVTVTRMVHNRHLKKVYHEKVVVRGRDGYAGPVTLPPRIADPVPVPSDPQVRTQAAARVQLHQKLHKLGILRRP